MLGDEDDIKLSTGRVFQANCGLVSIDSKLNVAQGYDGGIEGVNLDAAEYSNDPWSSEERMELADLMIERWLHFKRQSNA